MSEHSTSYLAARDEFVQLWGDMASSWGINKTMSQIHALLYAESQALHTDEIMSILGMSRGSKKQIYSEVFFLQKSRIFIGFSIFFWGYL